MARSPAQEYDITKIRFFPISGTIAKLLLEGRKKLHKCNRAVIMGGEGCTMQKQLSIGERIVDLRNAQRMSQKELAEKIGLSPSQLSRIETAWQPP